MNPRPDEDELDAAQERMVRTYGRHAESDFIRACDILHNMSLEYRRPWWKRVFVRWFISHEALRNDASRFLRQVGHQRMIPSDLRRVGDN